MARPHLSQQITFLHTRDLGATYRFYCELLELPLVRDQGKCLIFEVAPGAYLGFCEHIEPISAGRRVVLTLVSDDVDAWYAYLEQKGLPLADPPKANPEFQIYHFFLEDPNGYTVEIQKFDHPL